MAFFFLVEFVASEKAKVLTNKMVRQIRVKDWAERVFAHLLFISLTPLPLTVFGDGSTLLD